MTDAEKLAAIRALLDNPPYRKWIAVDEIINILEEQ